MTTLDVRQPDAFPEPAFAVLSREAFSDDEASPLLAQALEEEASTRAKLAAPVAESLRIGAEVYGPLVRLTYLPGERRRALHHARSTPIRPADNGQA